jgi:hypothetical protein
VNLNGLFPSRASLFLFKHSHEIRFVVVVAAAAAAPRFAASLQLLVIAQLHIG